MYILMLLEGIFIPITCRPHMLTTVRQTGVGQSPSDCLWSLQKKHSLLWAHHTESHHLLCTSAPGRYHSRYSFIIISSRANPCDSVMCALYKFYLFFLDIDFFLHFAGEVVLDPMCGGGSISLESSLCFPTTFNLMGDNHDLGMYLGLGACTVSHVHILFFDNCTCFFFTLEFFTHDGRP